MGTRHLTAHVHFAPPDAILRREHIERFSYVLEKLFRYVFVICFISQWMERTKQGLPNMEMALLDWPIVLQYDVTFLESSPASGLKFFQPSVRLTNQKPVHLYPFHKPIKSLYFRSFVVSVLFAPFYSKVIRKSLSLWIASKLTENVCTQGPSADPL